MSENANKFLEVTGSFYSELEPKLKDKLDIPENIDSLGDSNNSINELFDSIKVNAAPVNVQRGNPTRSLKSNYLVSRQDSFDDFGDDDDFDNVYEEIDSNHPLHVAPRSTSLPKHEHEYVNDINDMEEKLKFAGNRRKPDVNSYDTPDEGKPNIKSVTVEVEFDFHPSEVSSL